MNQYDIIKRPLITEKSTMCQEKGNQYFFAVHPDATKSDIRNAVEKIFSVKVVAVRTQNVEGKIRRVGRSSGRKPSWKKAMVALKEGDRIEFLEGA